MNVCGMNANEHSLPRDIIRLVKICRYTLVYESVKWKSLSHVWLFVTPMGFTVHGILQARILEWVAFSFSRGSSQPRGWTQVSCIAGGFFTSWAKGKPKNTGVGSLSLPQWIFLTQESNWGLMHCRQILYHLSYQRSQSQRRAMPKNVQTTTQLYSSHMLAK